MRIAEWARSVTETIRNTMPPDDELADVVADLQSAERLLAETRRMLMSELTGPLDGSEYRIVEGRAAKRSYNTSGLLAAFGGFDALPGLVAEDAVRLGWQWSKLQQAADRHDVTLSVAKHEIGDGDPEALVGEVWESKWRIEARR